MNDDKLKIGGEFISQVRSNQGESGYTYIRQLFEDVTLYIEEVGEIEEPVYDYFKSPDEKFEVHGFCLNESSDDLGQILNLFIVETDQNDLQSTLTQKDMAATFKRVTRFIDRCSDSSFCEGLSRVRDLYRVAEVINRRAGSIRKIKIILITDKKLSSRIDSITSGEVLGIEVVHSVWDINRIIEVAASGVGREPIEILFDGSIGNPISCLKAASEWSTYDAYLLVFPATVLAKIYDRWDTRLLEANVRVFLQAKGNVNRGIRDTLEHQPEKFLAFNNGITATASGVSVINTPNGLAISELHDLQIVNGGQTTASIHAAFRRGIPLEKVFVQVKLSVVGEEDSSDLVQRISRYANTQNKVSEADFFSHHPYHVRFEEHSRREFAPPREGEVRTSKWFYERARGQYLDLLARARSKSKIENEYPKKQVINKTDHAKFEMTFREFPHVVAKGAQGAFSEFAKIVHAEWGENGIEITSDYYRRAIGRAILFNESALLISRASWYKSGFRAQVVTYTWAKMVYDMSAQGKKFNFLDIWQNQRIHKAVEIAFNEASPMVYQVIEDADQSERNPAQWAKKVACWDKVKKIEIAYPKEFLDWCSSGAAEKTKRESSLEKQKMNKAAWSVRYLLKGPEFWKEFLTHVEANRIGLIEIESGVIKSYLIKNKPVSDQQARVLNNMFKRIEHQLPPSYCEF